MTPPFSGIPTDDLTQRAYYEYRGTTRAPKGALDGLKQRCNVLFLGVSEHGTLAVVPTTSIQGVRAYHMVSEGTLFPLPGNDEGVPSHE